jgi:hypothetical protein
MAEQEALGDILGRALAEIDEAGGSAQLQLKHLVGAKVFDAMRSKPRMSAIIDQWANAGPKSKSAATRTLALAIAHSADRPELVARIEREIEENTFDLPLAEKPKNHGKSRETPKRAPTPRETEKHAEAVRQVENDQRPMPDLAALARKGDMGQYVKARQGD